MYPHHEEKLRGDDYGEFISLEDFNLGEENKENVEAPPGGGGAPSGPFGGASANNTLIGDIDDLDELDDTLCAGADEAALEAALDAQAAVPHMPFHTPLPAHAPAHAPSSPFLSPPPLPPKPKLGGSRGPPPRPPSRQLNLLPPNPFTSEEELRAANADKFNISFV